MRIPLASVPGLWLLAAASCGAGSPRPEPSEARALFDGSSLSGWAGDERFWSVRDGVIVGESTAETPCERTQYLIHEGERFDDFVLEVEVALEGGNSGVQFRSQRAGPDLVGYQADLDAAGDYVGALYEQYGREILARPGERVSIGEDGAREAVPLGIPPPGALAPGWHRYRIEARGARVLLSVDGRPSAEVIDRERRRRRSSGLIGLQLHAGPPMKVSFRNVTIEELAPAAAADPEPALPPQWIWAEGAPRARQELWFRRTFDVPGTARAVRVFGAADDRMEVWWNGALVAESADWRAGTRSRTALDAVVSGENTLAVWTQNEEGPAGLWLEVWIDGATDERLRIVTDESWRVRAAGDREWSAPAPDDGGWSAARSLGPLGVPPWGGPGRLEARDPGRAPAGEEIEVPEGFRAELVYSVPRARQGSWVALAADGRGGFVASDQKGALYRLLPTLAPDRRARVSVERLPLALGAAQGLCVANGDLYVMVNGEDDEDENGLWRARDGDGDGTWDTAELLRALSGSGEHGPHAVVPTADGTGLWVLAGNHTDVPAPIDVARPRVVQESDALLPQENDPNGHPPGPNASGGWIARTDLDGKTWELVAVGLRNAYDCVELAEGELLTFDSDMEWDIGLPWYRETRVLHVVSGADYGWRHGSGKWPAWFADTLPACLEAGQGSPTGMVSGAGLEGPPRWKEALFAADWSFGRIRAFFLEPRGASFAAKSEIFASGRPLPVCDLALGDDGALWFVTGGRGVQSGVYRIAWTGASEEGAPVREREEAAARAERRALEAAHASAEPDVVERAWPHLAGDDPFLRNAARVAIERQDPALWRDRALGEEDPRAAAQLAIALAARGDASDRSALLAELGRFELATLEEAAERDVLRACDRVLQAFGAPEGEERVRLRERFEARFPSGRSAVDRMLFALLVFLESPEVVAGGLERLRAAETRADEIAYLFLLRTVAEGWSLDQRRAYLAALDRVLGTLEGGASFRNYLLAIRRGAVATLGDGERDALAELLEPPPAPAPAEAPSAPFVRSWTLAELLPVVRDVPGGAGDPARGAAAYRKASCLTCHRIDGEGGAQGPDLTTAAARYGAQDLLSAIMHPSSDIVDQYQDTEVWTNAGPVYVGTVVSEDERTLRVLVAGAPPETVEIEKADVELRRPSPLSKMPEGLLEVLTVDEIRDLFAYLLRR